jgi:hypothetical protein
LIYVFSILNNKKQQRQHIKGPDDALISKLPYKCA